MFEFEERGSDSPLVETVWHTRSEAGTPGQFTSVAVSSWELTLTRQQGHTRLTLRGPETCASPAPVPREAEFFGIHFRLGSFLPLFPTSQRVDGGFDLPGASDSRFWLNGSAWQYPSFDDADLFVRRLERAGLLARDPIVEQVLNGTLPDSSSRTVQRRFLMATGLSHRALRRIEQGRSAQALLAAGCSIADTVFMAGYADQPHLTRALKQLTGQTPAQIVRARETKEGAVVSVQNKTGDLVLG